MTDETKLPLSKDLLHRAIETAFEASKKAYVPYSHFPVGACVITCDDTLIPGANIENSSYGLSNCAERTAMFSAVMQGYLKDRIKALVVVAPTEEITPPCGACRQVMLDLLTLNTPVICTNHRAIKIFTVSELMPFAFSDESMK